MKDAPAMQCGGCRFFRCERAYEKPCEQLGKLEVSKQCSKYKPNVNALGEFLAASPKVVQAIGQLVSLIPASKLHILAAVLYNEKTTRKYGFNFLQKVYIPWRGDNDPTKEIYVKRFYVLEATKRELRLISQDGKTYYVHYMYKDSPRSATLYQSKAYSGCVHTSQGLRELRESLSANGVSVKVVDTDHYDLHKSHRTHIVYEDDVPEGDDTSKKAARYDIYDLSTMAREVERGFIVKSKQYKRRVEEPEPEQDDASADASNYSDERVVGA